MTNSLWILVIFWGIWIIIPVAFDGFLNMIYMLAILFKAKKTRPLRIDSEKLPKVSIVIPTYNEEENINECLNYLKIQTYPQDKLEIIVVDNGSTDATSEIVKKHMHQLWMERHGKVIEFDGRLKVDNQSYSTRDFQGLIRLIIRNEQGKAKALNAGILLSTGEIIINIDCRSYLAPDAVCYMVAKFLENPEYGAATGNIEIGWNMFFERTPAGRYILTKDGHYKQRILTRKEKFLSKAQFLEYLTSFRLGRQFQDITNSMYTFSGAFSAFRRDVLLNSGLYSSRTVAEDTDLTLNLHGQNVRLGYAEKAKAYLKPVISFEKLYAQRARWHRGQVEVIGLHLDWYGNFTKGFSRAFWHSVLLITDHTFGFPRIIWTFLLPLFFLFGYSMALIIKAIILMWAFYIFIDFINAGFCYLIADKKTRKKITDSLQYALITPVFRLIVFYLRFAGYLEAIKEPQKWSTPVNPVRSVKKYRAKAEPLKVKTLRLLKLNKKPYYEEQIPELDSFGLGQENNEE